jgi:hypothetical protein
MHTTSIRTTSIVGRPRATSISTTSSVQRSHATCTSYQWCDNGGARGRTSSSSDSQATGRLLPSSGSCNDMTITTWLRRKLSDIEAPSMRSRALLLAQTFFWFCLLIVVQLLGDCWFVRPCTMVVRLKKNNGLIWFLSYVFSRLRQEMWDIFSVESSPFL